MNTSTKITINQMSYMNTFIILSFCIFSSIILCLYAIFHNRQSISMSSMNKTKIIRKSYHNNMKQSLKRKKHKEKNILIMEDSNSSNQSIITQQTNSISWKTNSSNLSF